MEWIIGLLIGLVVGWAIAWGATRRDVAKLQNQLTVSQQQAEKVQTLEEANQEKRDQITELTTQKTHLQTQYAQMKQQSQDDQAAYQALLEKFNQSQVELAQLREQSQQQAQQYQEKIETLKESETRLSQQFENLANRIFQQKEEKFKWQSQNTLNQILAPFQKDINDFKKRVESIYQDETKERASLRKEIQDLSELNETMSQQAKNLTVALKGDQKAQGDWGEVILERVLEASGLRKGHEYDTQFSAKDDAGQTYRPDAIVYLPDNKQVIVDAKVSLTAYERYTTADDENQRTQALKQHIQSISAHIKGLSEKNYDQLEGVESLDFTLLFIPIEAAFVLAFQQDKQLFNQAFKKHIIIVTPTTLLATLRTIYHAWKHDKQNQNAAKIAQRAEHLLNKFRGLCESLEELGSQLSKSQHAYDETMKKLTKGKGNLVQQTMQLQELGVSMRKSLPQQIQQDAEISHSSLQQEDE